MSGRDIIVIGGSAGGIQAVCDLVRQLPADFPAALFVVIHRSATSSSVLPEILTGCGHLSATNAEDEELIETGRIYVAPPDYHLLVTGDRVCVSQGPKENYARPAIDPLFRSAAQTCGKRVVGVVLSGNLYDGAAGLLSIKQHGGIAIVQEPEDALYPGMPRNAIAKVAVDHVVPVSQMGSLLVNLVEMACGNRPSVIAPTHVP